jgi:hypothetical protein
LFSSYVSCTCHAYRYYLSRGPLHCRRVPAKDVESGIYARTLLGDQVRCTYRCHEITGDSYHIFRTIQLVAVIYLDILPTQPMKIRVPYDLTSVENWLTFRAHMKTLAARPFDSRDVTVLQRRHQQRQQLRQHLGPVSAISTVAAASRTGLPLSLEGVDTPNKRMKVPLNREHSSSSQRVGTNTGRSGADPILSVQPSNGKSMLGKAFTLEVSLVTKVDSLLRRFAQELCVEPRHLALYFTPTSGGTDWEERRLDVQPITAFHRGMAINDALKSLRVSTKPSTKYAVFYRILPLPLLDSDGENRVVTERLMDIYITDERLRYWRGLYLDQLRARLASAPPGSLSADGQEVTVATAARQDTGAAGDNPPGSLTHSRTCTIAGTSVIWPDASTGEYDALEVKCVHLSCPRTARVDTFMSALRAAIGLPTNFDELEALKPATDDEGAADVAGELVASTGGAELLCTGRSGLCSDMLHTDPDTGAVLPGYPLLVYNIRDLCILHVATAENQAGDLVNFE